MPFVLFIAYILLESLAFWAVAQWIGVLWALLALALTMLFGMSIASWEVRRMMSSRIRASGDGAYVMEDPTPGKTAGNVGLTMVGGLAGSAFLKGLVQLPMLPFYLLISAHAFSCGGVGFS